MPTLWAHTQYFATTSTVVPAALADSGGGYPRWQASNIALGSLLGGCQAFWERFVWWVGLWKRRAEIERALDALAHPKAPPTPGIIYVPSAPVVRIIKEPAVPQVCKKPHAEDVPPLSDLTARVDALTKHPAFPFALEAVKQTATTLGFNRPEAWQGLSRHMKASPGRAENTFRHMHACQLTRETAGSTLTNPDCNLLVELAYHAFARKGGS